MHDYTKFGDQEDVGIEPGKSRDEELMYQQVLPLFGELCPGEAGCGIESPPCPYRCRQSHKTQFLDDI